jgi:hypothetical protein
MQVIPWTSRKGFPMKHLLTAALVGIVLILGGASAQANPPAVVAQAPPAVQKDGPYRLLLAAKADARHRRAQGFHADVVREDGVWWVVYYP